MLIGEDNGMTHQPLRGTLARGANGLLILLILLACASCGDDGESRATQQQVLADDIPVAHTPVGGYGSTFPAPILARCTEPLVAGAPDLRGSWGVVEVLRNGRPAPTDDPVYAYVERIEQCGNRLIVTGGGVIHDMRCDGTIEHGVHDVAQADFTTPITVVATYENEVHTLRPVGINVVVTRQLDGSDMVWHYLNFVARLRHIPPL